MNIFAFLFLSLISLVAAQATPTPTPVPVKVLTALFKALKISDVDPSACVNDVAGAGKHLRDFADDISTGNYTEALDSLGQGVSSLSTSVSGCGVAEVESKLDGLAAAIKFAKITKLDSAVKIIVGAANLEKDVEAFATAVKSGNPTNIGNALSSLLDGWTAVTGGCSSGSKACNFIDGLLRIVQTVATDYAPCAAAVEPAYAQFEDGVTKMHSQNVTGAVQDFAQGLDTLAKALDNDSCGLKNLADVLSKIAPKLAKAIVKDNTVIVEYADVYDELFAAAIAVEDGDVVAFGMAVGRMLQSLRASGCKTKFCVVLQGILGTLQLESADFAQCSSDADSAWAHMESAVSDFERKSWGPGVSNLASAVSMTAKAVSDCGVSDLAKILEDTATKLGDSALATEIGSVASILVEGADVTDQLSKTAADFKSKNYNALGSDLHQLSSMLAGTKCSSIVCKVVEGLLNMAGTAYQDLQACSSDLRAAETNFIAGSQDFKGKKYGSGLNQWATGLNSVAKAVKDCGLEDELGFIEQEANVLGLGNVTIVGDIGSIVVHGADFYEQLYQTLQDLETHDWRSAGHDMGAVLDQLSTWTKGHACTSDMCYVVVGVLQFMGDIDGSVKECETDFKDAWDDFKDGFDAFADSHHSIFHFEHNADKVKEGVKAFGNGMKQVAKAVTDCHLEEFAELLTELAVKLGIVPEVGWLEELLHILIEGVHIENEVGDACVDYGDGNWVGFGYNVAKLVKTLL
jgi:hypothetical protein